LTLQTGRYLISCWKDALKGKHLPEGVAYMNVAKELLIRHCDATDASFFADPQHLIEAMSVAVTYSISTVYHQYEIAKIEGLDHEAALDSCAILLQRTTKLHCQCYLLRRFNDVIHEAPPEVAGVLTQLCILYGVFSISENLAPYLQCGYFSNQQSEWIERYVSDI
jgi:acyl-CoA oxidase